MPEFEARDRTRRDLPSPSGESQHQQGRINALLALWKSESLRQGPLAEILQKITEAGTEILDVDRVGVWIFSDDRAAIRALDVFQRSTAQHTNGQRVAAAANPLYFAALEQNLTIAADDVCTDCRTVELSETYLAETGVTSMLDAPIRGPQGLQGVLCHEHTGPVRRWTAEDQMLAASLADLVSNAFEADRRSRAEAKMRENEQRLRILFDDSPDAIFVEGLDALVIDVNSAGCALYGMRREELIGKHVLELVPPDQRDSVTRLFNQMANGELSEFESYCWTADQREVPVEITASQIVYGGQDAVLLHVRDITFRRQAQEALWRSENRYRDLVETSHDLIWSVDVEGRWTFLNREATLSIYGYEPEEMLGRSFTEMEDLEYAVRDLEVFARIKAGEPVHQYETVHRRKDGTHVHLSFNAVPQYDGQGDLTGATGSAIDITKRKQIDQELERQRQSLAQVSRLSTLGQLVGGLAHELAQPLSAVSNYVAACKSQIEKSPQMAGTDLAKMIGEISTQATRAGDILRQLRGSVRGAPPERVQLPVSRVIDEALRIVAAELNSHAIPVAKQLENPTPIAWANRLQLQQVLINVVKNAIEAMSRQSRTSRRLTIRSWSNEEIHVSVADQGPGMAQEQVDRCFDTFYTTKKEGLGMGLAICRSILAEHDGRIWLESKPGRGTTVHFTLRPSEQPLE